MEGKGRCLDNVFVERLWRSLEFEEVYLRKYDGMTEAHAGMALPGLLRRRARAPSARLPDAGGLLRPRDEQGSGVSPD